MKDKLLLWILCVDIALSAHIQGEQEEQEVAVKGHSREKRELISLGITAAGVLTALGSTIGGWRGSTCRGEYCAWGNTHPCSEETNFNYGCYNGFCWSQCSATSVAEEWCYTAQTQSGRYYTCTDDSQCKTGTDCRYSSCAGACSVI